jgi:peptide/nickel transport system substrate-binding protein
VEDEILTRLEKGGKGRVVLTPGSRGEYVFLNFSDPWTEVEGERSSPKSRHPVLSDPAVRAALSLALDRTSIQKFIYGRTASLTTNFTENPERYRSKNNVAEFNLEKAAKLLDEAGWVRGPDGVRTKAGKKLKFLFTTTVNQPRQKTQAIFKQACQKVGIELELKAVMASVFFSVDFANPDVANKFYCDLQLHSFSMGVDPWAAMRGFCSWEVASKANKWMGGNKCRWRNEAFDEAYRAAEGELDPVKRAALIIRMNDLVVQDRVVLPLVSRMNVTAASHQLQLQLSGWGSSLTGLRDWYRTT